MKLAFLYAGQGSQHVGMGADLYATYPAFKAIWDSVSEKVLGFDLKQLCFEGPAEQLAQTQFTQPCLVAFAAGVTAILYGAGLEPEFAAGLSLGEYSALCAAGVFDPKTAIALAAFRGNAMEAAVKDRPCGMAAVLYLDRIALQAACDQAADLGVVEIANYNCPGQLAIAGDAAAVTRAGALALAAGAKRVVPLNVSGPFHTSLMAPAGDALGAKFQTVEFAPMAFPVFFNCKGGPLAPGETIPALLERQVQSSVYFEEIVLALEREGVDTIIEIGPGKVLSGFVKKTAKSIKTYAAETVQDIAIILAALKGVTE